MVTRLKVKYLLHHAVFRDDKKTTKCSVVFDASAYDEHEVSLDECRFCQGQHFNLILYQCYFDSEHARNVTLMADVEKMFLQIKVDERNQEALRYL